MSSSEEDSKGSAGTVPVTNKEIFIETLTKEYINLFETADYHLAAARYTPQELAEKMTKGIIEYTANKDGKGIKNTCKKLDIKHTYTAMRFYLTGEN